MGIPTHIIELAHQLILECLPPHSCTIHTHLGLTLGESSKLALTIPYMLRPTCEYTASTPTSLVSLLRTKPAHIPKPNSGHTGPELAQPEPGQNHISNIQPREEDHMPKSHPQSTNNMNGQDGIPQIQTLQ